MINHTLLMRLEDGTLALDPNAVFQTLFTLCGCIGEVKSLECGPDGRAQGFTHAFVIVFGDMGARDAFCALPGYAAVLEPMQAKRSVQVISDGLKYSQAPCLFKH